MLYEKLTSLNKYYQDLCQIFAKQLMPTIRLSILSNKITMKHTLNYRLIYGNQPTADIKNKMTSATILSTIVFHFYKVQQIVECSFS